MKKLISALLFVFFTGFWSCQDIEPINAIPQVEALSHDKDFIELVKINQTIADAVYNKMVSMRTFENVEKHKREISEAMKMPATEKTIGLTLNLLGLEKTNTENLLTSFAKHVKVLDKKYPNFSSSINPEVLSNARVLVEEEIKIESYANKQQTNSWWDRNYCSDCVMANCDYCNGSIPEGGGGFEGAHINPIDAPGSVNATCIARCNSIRSSKLALNRDIMLGALLGCGVAGYEAGSTILGASWAAGPYSALAAGIGGTLVGGICAFWVMDQYYHNNNIVEVECLQCIAGCK
jgi:hypothetical protein